MLIESGLQGFLIFVAGWTVAGGRGTELSFSAADCAFGLDGNVSEPFGNADEGLFHGFEFPIGWA